MTEPSVPRAYRAFQIVYAILTLNFFFPAVSYLVDPKIAIGQIDRINRMLGGGPYPEIESGQVWHMLAVGNVMTLAFLCALLFLDLRRFYPSLPGLAFLKGFSSLYSLGIAIHHHLPVFYAVFVLDGVSVAAMIVFAVSAHRALEREGTHVTMPLERLTRAARRPVTS